MKIRLVSTNGVEQTAEASDVKLFAWGIGIEREVLSIVNGNRSIVTTVYPWTSIAFYEESKAPGERAIVVAEGLGGFSG